MERPDDPTSNSEGPDDTNPAYRVLFQSWIILVLLILCIALLQYLLLKLTG
ncbi:MAG TPA: hypothetical protein VMZ71_04225 [Gemmataceae bacterium]|nr:hypothetical protein [Gemmataceae bacterium]